MTPVGQFEVAKKQATEQFPVPIQSERVGQFTMPAAVGQYIIPPPAMPGVLVIQLQGLTMRPPA